MDEMNFVIALMQRDLRLEHRQNGKLVGGGA
jgi:hypothetical protein